MTAADYLHDRPTNGLFQQGTGTLGSIILASLLASPGFEVSVLSRTSSTATFPASVSVVTADYDSEDELVKAFTGQDAIVSAVGGPGFTQQRAFILAAIKAGVKHFVPSEYSTNTRSDAVRRLVPLFEAKQKVLNLLKEKESPTFSWTGLATGPLLDWVGQFGAYRKHLGPTDVH